mmetsp:Transcript_48564/g.155884  ORF Transcript_48564/g.155884 Transcript_48564/m.155884 type:complete len:87 (-) Transcript_48564:312-572(-)
MCVLAGPLRFRAATPLSERSANPRTQWCGSIIRLFSISTCIVEVYYIRELWCDDMDSSLHRQTLRLRDAIVRLAQGYEMDGTSVLR